MLKNCVIDANGEIINYGDWDYQYQSVEITPAEYDESGNVIIEAVYENQAQNHFPTGATIEEIDMDYTPDRGWFKVGTTEIDPDQEIAEAITSAKTLEELKKALLGNNGSIARVKGRMK